MSGGREAEGKQMVIKIHVYEKLADAEPVEIVEFVGATENEANEQVTAWFESQGDRTVICDVEIIHSDTAREFVFIGKP